jgi:glycosyltransferase involved in cell wall biosynthesis
LSTGIANFTTCKVGRSLLFRPFPDKMGPSGPAADGEYSMSAARPKILFVVAEDWYFWSHRRPIASAALQNSYDVFVATRVGDCGEKIIEAGFRLIPLRLDRSSYSLFHELRTVSELRSIYRREKPDIIHHIALKPILYGSIAALGNRRIQVINAFAGLGYLVSSPSFKARMLKRVLWKMFRFLLNRPNSFLLLQNREDRDLLVAEVGVPPEKTTIIRGSGVDVNEFQAIAEVPSVPIVLLSSRMLWIKGISDFVEAAKLLHSRGVRARFVLAGDTDPGSPGAIPREKLQEWQNAGRVEWWGHQQSMSRMLQQSAIVCLPSHGGEGVPKALIEAAASERAIVATDVPGCRDIVRHGTNGLLVPPKNPAALADAIATLLNDPSLRAAMGRRGREIAVNEFSEEKVIQQTLALYRQLLSGGTATVNADDPVREI